MCAMWRAFLSQMQLAKYVPPKKHGASIWVWLNFRTRVAAGLGYVTTGGPARFGAIASSPPKHQSHGCPF